MKDYRQALLRLFTDQMNPRARYTRYGRLIQAHNSQTFSASESPTLRWATGHESPHLQSRRDGHREDLLSNTPWVENVWVASRVLLYHPGVYVTQLMPFTTITPVGVKDYFQYRGWRQLPSGWWVPIHDTEEFREIVMYDIEPQLDLIDLVTL